MWALMSQVDCVLLAYQVSKLIKASRSFRKIIKKLISFMIKLTNIGHHLLVITQRV